MLIQPLFLYFCLFFFFKLASSIYSFACSLWNHHTDTFLQQICTGDQQAALSSLERTLLSLKGTHTHTNAEKLIASQKISQPTPADYRLKQLYIKAHILVELMLQTTHCSQLDNFSSLKPSTIEREQRVRLKTENILLILIICLFVKQTHSININVL